MRRVLLLFQQHRPGAILLRVACMVIARMRAFSVNPCPVISERRIPLDDVYFLLTKNFLLDRPNRPLITLTTQFAAEKRYSGNGRR